MVCSRIRELQEALSAATIALEISSRNARVAALQKRWDRLRAGLDLILDQRGAEMADLSSGASGLPVRDSKGNEADRLVTRIDPGAVSLSPNSAPTSATRPRNWSRGRPARSASPRRLAGGDHAGPGLYPGAVRRDGTESADQPNGRDAPESPTLSPLHRTQLAEQRPETGERFLQVA